MSNLALPDPQTTTVARIPDVVKQSGLIRAHCRETHDRATAEELRRRLGAFARYIQDKEARSTIQGECRLTEVLIGELLGPAVNRGPATFPDRKGSAIRPADRHEFRELANNADAVEALVAGGTVERSKILAEIRRREQESEAVQLPETDELRHGDFRKVLADLPNDCADLIFTDPPYDRDTIPLYGDLAELAARVLRPGGSMLAYCGQYALPEIMALTLPHLRWWWLCGCYHEGGNHKSLPGIKTYVLWKPIVWFVKGTNGSSEFVHDMIPRPMPDKTRHDWAQSTVDAEHYISKLSRPGGLVIDPFAGGGTTLAVAKQLGRRVIGAEADRSTYLRALGALAA